MARNLINAAAGGAGIATTAANVKLCSDADFFRALPQQCAGWFGPLSDWAAANPVIAAAVLFAGFFLVAQVIQTFIGKMLDL